MNEPKFAESGRLSRAWWIKLVKDEGAGGGTVHLSEEAHRPYPETKKFVDHLVMTGHIKMTGNGGRNGYQYQVTSFGHRYLEGHKDELEGVAELSKPDTRSHLGSDVRSAPVAPHPVLPVTPPAPAEPVRPPSPSARSSVRAVLADILIEKFADQVTAKELLERLERNGT